MNLFMKIFLSVIGIIILLIAGGAFYITRGLDSGRKLEINEVNLTQVNDGAYEGIYKAGRWTNELNVLVKDHKITDIKVIKDVSFSNPEQAKQVFNEVIEKQSTKVDVVSGASVTTKAYLKSIENALK